MEFTLTPVGKLAKAFFPLVDIPNLQFQKIVNAALQEERDTMIDFCIDYINFHVKSVGEGKITVDITVDEFFDEIDYHNTQLKTLK